MKRAMIVLIIMIPLSSVLLGVLMFYLATSDADSFVAQDRPPLSKTSWQEQE